MPPVGNDIVDLADPENIGKSADGRFCRRVFNDGERAAIAAAEQPDVLLWALWAAKEAAYKALSRQFPEVNSIPRRYPVRIETVAVARGGFSFPGFVDTPRGPLFLSIVSDSDLVHALAASSRALLDRVVSRVERIEPSQQDASEFVRKILLHDLAGFLGCDSTELSFVKMKEGPGAPSVLLRDGLLQIDASISHDGRFVAYAFDPEFVRQPFAISAGKESH